MAGKSTPKTLVEEALTKTEAKSTALVKVDFVDLVEFPSKEEEEKVEGDPLSKALYGLLNGESKSIERLAFKVDPSLSHYGTIYRPQLQGVPNDLKKRIAIQDDLVAHIIQTREHQALGHGRPRPDRFSTGYAIAPNVGVVEKCSPEEKETLDKRIERAIRLFLTCGSTENLRGREHCTFTQWLMESVRNAMTIGWIATEKAFTPENKFHSFRSIDAGTIYRANRYQSSAESVRKQALQLLAQLKNEKLVPERFTNDEYEWIQVIKGMPRQAFTERECSVYNFYPANDVELDGYPVAPIDTVISAIVTHISIVQHNKLYFQTGRAARGMLIFKGDDIDEKVIKDAKQQFWASVNSVSNAWRMPVFQCPADGDITWAPIDNSSRDAEFQYLTDTNARVILSAFQIAPEELPGWAYLSRGTSSQALSESNNEWKLEAARDLGIRPLLAKLEDFINKEIFPLIDPELAAVSRFTFVGLDAETPEKEAVRLQQDMPVHGTYDWVLEKVEKQPIGTAMGGDFPLNPQYQAVLDKYYTVGQIMEFFMGVKDASKNPDFAYVRDPFWFNNQNLKLQAQQMQAQAAQQQAAAPGPGGDANQEIESQPGVDDPNQPAANDNGEPDERSDKQKDANDQQVQQAQQDQATGQATSAIDQAIGALSKGEEKLPPAKRRLLAKHRKVVKQALDGWDRELDETTKQIIKVATSGKARKT